MTNLLNELPAENAFHLPAELGEKHPHWRAIVNEKCPLLALALNYAQKNALKIEFLSRKLDEDKEIGANTDLGTKNIVAYLDTGLSITKLFRRVAHEIKHVTQLDDFRGWLDWRGLNKDLMQTLKTKVYKLAVGYNVPSISDDMFIFGCMELDAYFFDKHVGRECGKAFSRLPFSNPFLSRSHLDRICHRTLKYPEGAVSLLNQSIQLNYKLVRTQLTSLAIIKHFCGELPFVEQIPVTAERMQKMMGSFWQESGYIPPYCAEQAIEKLEALRLAFAEDEICKSMTDDLNEIIAGRIPKAYQKFLYRPKT